MNPVWVQLGAIALGSLVCFGFWIFGDGGGGIPFLAIGYALVAVVVGGAYLLAGR